MTVPVHLSRRAPVQSGDNTFGNCENWPQECCPLDDCRTIMTLDKECVVQYLIDDHDMEVEGMSGHGIEKVAEFK